MVAADRIRASAAPGYELRFLLRCGCELRFLLRCGCELRFLLRCGCELRSFGAWLRAVLLRRWFAFMVPRFQLLLLCTWPIWRKPRAHLVHLRF
jgi:hypothetical protein